ncbi:QueT transporter family protein [Clostridiaceae bacterium M8S5]|nr:QueT transporter family protein [Clostridiaceae bacterium M8S5]
MVKDQTKFLVLTGLIAAVYVVVTITFSFMSYGPVQFRISEIMVFFAFIDPLYIPGLVIGCFVANLFGPFGVIDAIVGSTATFFAVYMISKCRSYIKNTHRALFVASLFPAISSVIIALQIYVLGKGSFLFWSTMIAIGELAVVTLVGFPLFSYIFTKPNLVKILTIKDNYDEIKKV